MTSKEVAKKETGGLANTASSAMTTTTETISSVAANLGGAFSFSGGASAGAHSYSKKTTTTSGADHQLSKKEADIQYEERMEEEYAKREGGA